MTNLNSKVDKVYKSVLVLSQNKGKVRLESNILLAALLGNLSIFIKDFFVRKTNIDIDSLIKELLETKGSHFVYNIKRKKDWLLNLEVCDFIHDSEKFIGLAYGQKTTCDHLLFNLIKNDKFSIDFLKRKGIYKDLYNKLDLIIKAWNGERQSIDEISSTSFSEGEVFIECGGKMKDSSFTSNEIGIDYFKNDEMVGESFCENVSEKVKSYDFHPAIGRENEIIEVAQDLNKLSKPNCILIGEAGVGKTAVVEGLAYELNRGDFLVGRIKGKEVYSLNMANFISGTKYRGEMESKVSSLIEFLKKKQEIILFIDEIHMIVGGGATANCSNDIANLLKPVLAKGKILCVGATTQNEYEKFICRDSALERRFSIVKIEEPTPEKMKGILLGIKSRYEKHHLIVFSDNDIDNIIISCVEFIKNRRFPDKAIDIIDGYGSYLNINSLRPSKVNFIDYFCSKVKEDKKEESLGFSRENDKSLRQKMEELLNE